jgi:hypothetical protein
VPIKVGLDWDGTVSEDVETFGKVVKTFLDAGHEVKVVTWRRPVEESEGCKWGDLEDAFDLWGFRIPVIYCSGQAKRDFYPADIWIEDNPAAVMFSLDREPRFVENARDYDMDVMVCENEHGSIETTFGVLNPRYGA